MAASTSEARASAAPAKTKPDPELILHEHLPDALLPTPTRAVFDAPEIGTLAARLIRPTGRRESNHVFPGASAAALPATPTTTPSISVTIGRVDVRAVFPQPQEQKRARPSRPAPMSLDEYVKQQNKGRK